MSNKTNWKPRKEYVQKSIPAFVLKTDEAEGTVEAIVNVYGIIDLAEDILHPGVFVKSIVERAGKIRVLDNHRTDSALAAIGQPLQIREIDRSELPAKVLEQFPEATGGLWTLTKFNMKTSTGRDLFYSVQAGDLNEWSIGFNIIQSSFGKVNDPATGKPRMVRHIREGKLMEYSLVLWGANQATYTGDIKQEKPTMTTQQNNPTAAKEYTPDGAVVRIGDKIKACTFDTFMGMVNRYYKDGYLSGDEHRSLVELGTTLLDTLGSMDDEVAMREFDDPFMGFFMFAGEAAEEAKRAIAHQQKAGKVIAQRNVERLERAADEIMSVLAEAKPENTAGAEENSNGEKNQNSPEAGSQDIEPNAPTSDLDEAKALEELKALKEQLATH